MPRLVARAMPAISAASRTSRKSMIAVASIAAVSYFPMALLCDQKAAIVRLKIIKELVPSRLQRADIDRPGRARRDHLLAAQRMAFEFSRALLLVLDRQFDFRPGGHLNFSRRKPAV